MSIPDLLAALVDSRVGGTYWGHQPLLPPSPWTLDGTVRPLAGSLVWPEDADPWHMLAGADIVRLSAGDGRILLALAAGKSVLAVAGDEEATEPTLSEISDLARLHFTEWQWYDPFNGAVITLFEAIELAGFWRKLIDANRTIAAVMGFAYWKRPTIAPLLWNGTETRFTRALPKLLSDQTVAVWRSRLSAAQKSGIAKTMPVCLEVEDGFIRSAGLGADCVPPLSVIVDPIGVHFDPTRPSKLEELLQHGYFPDDLLLRAVRLREAIVAGGLSKYERREATALSRPGGDRLHVLVPGQVEDDRAVTSGGALPSNLELLRRARGEAGPDAFLIYKPHPDVLAGHRRGSIAEADMAALADQVETNAPMASLIAMADELHVNSSLAGFEALLRAKPVTVHGVPFYAGWGLTRDRGPVPPRRTARRTLDELVAATLLLYPLYLDPVTGLPCPAEVLVERLVTPSGLRQERGRAAAVVSARRVQGRAKGLVQRMLGR